MVHPAARRGIEGHRRQHGRPAHSRREYQHLPAPLLGYLLRRVRGTAAGRQAAHRGRRVALRADLPRLADRARDRRDTGDPGHVPRSEAAHQVHAARLPRRTAALPRRPRVRAQQDRHPRHLPHVLRPRGLRLPGGRQGRIPPAARRGGRARTLRRGRPRARNPEVASGGRGADRPGRRDQAGRGLVRAGVRRPVRRMGHGRAPDGRAQGLRARRAGAGRKVAARHVRRHPSCVTYIATWSGWLVTSTGYDRNYAQLNGVNTPVISPLYSLFEYHKEILNFMTTLSSRHPYMSQPWDWFVISRPVAFYWTSFADASGTHVAKSGTTGPYVQEVLAIGNPAIWWVSIPAILFCLAWWLTRRDWRAGTAVLGVAAGWATWLPFVSRTKFYYYALEFEPFMIICIVLCLGLMIGPATAGRLRRIIGSALAGIYVLAALILFWYFYPILAGKVIPYSDWLSHMWYSGWI